jgi:hypothetical protein
LFTYRVDKPRGYQKDHQQLVKITVPPTTQTDHGHDKYWNALGLPRPF